MVGWARLDASGRGEGEGFQGKETTFPLPEPGPATVLSHLHRRAHLSPDLPAPLGPLSVCSPHSSQSDPLKHRRREGGDEVTGG